MAVEIKITTSSGNLLPATQDLIQQRSEAFAEANRRTKEVRVSVDDSDPAKPSAEVTAVIGTEKVVGTGSAGNTLKAVETALGKIQRQRSQQQQERSDERKSEEDAADSDGGMKVVGGVAGILFAGVFAVIMARSGSCSYNPADYPDTATVTGTVTLDGQPLEGALVSFTPSDGSRPAKGTTDSSGNYELRYTGAIKGAVLGTQSVVIVKSVPDPDYVQPANEVEDEFEPDPNMINIIPDRYWGTNSELTAEVAEGKNTIDFELTSE